VLKVEAEKLKSSSIFCLLWASSFELSLALQYFPAKLVLPLNKKPVRLFENLAKRWLAFPFRHYVALPADKEDQKVILTNVFPQGIPICALQENTLTTLVNAILNFLEV